MGRLKKRKKTGGTTKGGNGRGERRGGGVRDSTTNKEMYQLELKFCRLDTR